MSETNLMPFAKSAALSMGIELELQLVERRTGDLTRAASDLLALVERKTCPGEVKPEITESMIEISTDVQTRFADARTQLRLMRDVLVACADKLNVGIAGGGAHPFQRWYERQIYDRPRFRHVAGLYGYLAKQFTVFGQHVHIGCESGTQALRLLHSLARYVPQFIALAGASPHYQGVDTGFDCSRLNTIFAFPLSGRAPFVTEWSAFEAYFAEMKRLGVVESMKDFYWDIRPKPEYGTVEVRVFDTPLTVDRAAALAAYVQAVAAMLIERINAGEYPRSESVYLTYSYNRFQACRFGLEGQVIDAGTGASVRLAEDVLATLAACRTHARALASEEAMEEIEALVRAHGNDARWQRERYQHDGALSEVVLAAAQMWAGR
jgi:carboxylate-amine ligase